MKRPVLRLGALSLALLVAAPVLAESLPVPLARTLPARADAIAAIDAHPAVARARGEQAASEARAAGRLRGSHDWIAGGQWQRRDAGTDGRFDEWEASVQRGLRLPGKAAVDRRMAGLEVSVGQDRLADARHMAAIGLLEGWLEWLAAVEQSALAVDAAALAGRDLAATRLRHEQGDASVAEREAAIAAEAQAARANAEAALREQEARTALSLRFPAISLPASPPRIEAPATEGIDWADWAQRVVAVSHEITLADGLAGLAGLRAERARRDLRADPTVGLRALSERGGNEKALAVFFSVPLGSGARRAVADEDAGLADAALADAATTRLEVGLHATSLARRAQGQAEAWRLARVAADAHREEADRLAQGHALGGVGLAELLAARRRANESAAAEVEARAAAFAAAARLLLDAHAYWIDDDGHSEGHDAGDA